MSSVIFVARSIPSDIGHGGRHRAYQVLHDLKRAVGNRHVAVISWYQWRHSYRAKMPHPNRLTHVVGKIRRGLTLCVENPYKLLANTFFTTGDLSAPGFLEDYERIVKDTPSPAICIIDDVRFADLLQTNLRYGIPTISCIQNLESFDNSVLDHKQKWGVLATAIDFANEFRVLANCFERLFISKVETGLMSGLGLSAHYYPYLPVGAIRQRLLMIRQKRSRANIEPGLFLMLGNVVHHTTRESFAWFVENAQSYGLPEGVRLVIGGEQTDTLLPPETSVPGLELRGWLEQDELDRLLVQAQAVLAPQRRGFGALTRLPELSCAGVPVIASRHSTYAIDPTPGLLVVDDDWGAWHAKMTELTKNRCCSSTNDYDEWEATQPRTLELIVGKMLEVF
jgi:glycosyltransferase involved in cell wall biosynthesis